jgi:hypothetical protein
MLQIPCCPKLEAVGQRRVVRMAVLDYCLFRHLCQGSLLESVSLNLEWGVKENQTGLTALRNCGKSYSKIFELLEPLNILRLFIFRGIKGYEELWRVEDRDQSGGLRSLRAQAAVKTVRAIRSGNRRSWPES